MNLEKEVFEIALKDIMPNRFQPREVFDEAALNELAASIKEHGVIQPIIVRKVGDKYEIIAGERRYRASEVAGRQTIPALVRDMDDKEAAKIALLENLQRKDLTAIEEARTYQTILKLDNITQEELAENLGKSQSTIANKLRLLNLDESVQNALLNEQISERHARSLLNIDDPIKQKELLERVIQNRMTVRSLDEEIAKITGKQVEPILEEEQVEEQTPQQEQQNVLPNVNFNQTPVIEITDSNDIKIVNEEPVNKTFDLKAETIVNQQEQDILPYETPSEKENKELITDFMVNKEEVELSKVNNIINTEKKLDEINEKPHNIFENLRVISTDQAEQLNEKEKEFPNFIKPQEPVIEQTKEVNLNEIKEPIIPIQETPEPENINKEIYDFRFAINNVRQAIQNTEKFGFKVNSEELDLGNTYQIIITINKDK